jgi:hypothetical protein
VSLRLGPKTLGQAEILGLLRGWIEACRAVAATKEAHQDAVTVRRGIAPEARTLQKALKALLRRYFGTGHPMLEAFGIAPEPPALTPAQEALAAARRSLTRTRRRAMRPGWREPLLVAGGPPSPAPPSDPETAPPELILLWSDDPSGGTPGSSPALAPEPAALAPDVTPDDDLPWVK